MTSKQYNAAKDWLSGKDPQYVIKLKNKSKKLQISFEMRSKNNFMGRFGGGWQWKLGFQACKTSIIISLLVAELSISWYGLTKRGKEYYEKLERSDG
jgi:hypothetical protein